MTYEQLAQFIAQMSEEDRGRVATAVFFGGIPMGIASLVRFSTAFTTNEPEGKLPAFLKKAGVDPLVMVGDSGPRP